jgi:hypothetical protein
MWPERRNAQTFNNSCFGSDKISNRGLSEIADNQASTPVSTENAVGGDVAAGEVGDGETMVVVAGGFE